jgi:ribose transport system permease protein
MNINRSLIRTSSFPAFVLVVVLILVNAVYVPHFFNQGFISGFFSSYTPLIVAAMAQTLVLIGGGIDLSIGGTISLTVVSIVTLADPGGSYHYPLPAAMAIGLVIGLLAGALNGVVIGVLRVTPLLATLATFSITEGTALTIMSHPGGSIDIHYPLWYGSMIFHLIPASLVIVVIAYLIWVIWSRSPKGLQLYAMGKDKSKAYATGIPVSWIQFLIYAGSGLFSSIAAIALLGTTGAGDPTVGATYTLYAVAAAVVGGVSMMGGKGDIAGSILGALFLGLAFTLVFALRLESYYQDLASGLIVLLGILGASLLKKQQAASSGTI